MIDLEQFEKEELPGLKVMWKGLSKEFPTALRLIEAFEGAMEKIKILAVRKRDYQILSGKFLKRAEEAEKALKDAEKRCEKISDEHLYD